MPWTTLSTPGGSPASSTRSASSEHESGDHSAGLSTTVQPAASAGAVFHVESMNGAFHGVITTAGPARHPHARGSHVPFERHVALLVGDGEVGVAAVVARTARDHPRAQRPQQHRHVRALDRGQPLDVRVDQVGEAVQVRRRGPRAPSAAHAGKASVRRRRPRDRPRAAPPRATSASGCASIGEMSVNVARSRDALAADEVVERDVDADDVAGRSQLRLHDLEVVDRVGEREAVALPDPAPGRAACAPRAARRAAPASRGALPHVGHEPVAADASGRARAPAASSWRPGGEAREVADVDDRRRVVERPARERRSSVTVASATRRSYARAGGAEARARLHAGVGGPSSPNVRVDPDRAELLREALDPACARARSRGRPR